MKKKKIILIASLFIILLLAVVYFLSFKNKQESSNQPEITNSNPNSITYYCQEGKIEAIYGTENVTITFNNETKILPHSISADGTRYELDNLVFWSKGENAFLMKNDNQIYSKCVTGTMTAEKDLNTYTDSSKTFSFSFPKQFNFYGGDIGFTPEWSAEYVGSGMVFAVVSIPQSFFTKTNFGEAKFSIGASSDPEVIKNCLSPQNVIIGSKEENTINNRKFTKITFENVGAGNYYDTTSYRTILNDQCYAVEYTIHSTNINNYSPDQGIQEFDKTKITSLLENMVKSFKLY
ncbi:MAG TPA: MliC family protein [Candidatus Paceibacterota bacterium]|nr:MliC family protein [Candidatus Paceibacterota bacterium]HPT18102.1 MliC family protein [Candidatus Paceibacterota bacterium]